MEDMHNKLDDFLRSQLNDSSEDPFWNVPDDAIFEKAMLLVPTGRKKRRKVWIILSLLLLAGLIGSMYFHDNQIRVLQQKINNPPESIFHQSPVAESVISKSKNALSDLSSSDNLSSSQGAPIELPGKIGKQGKLKSSSISSINHRLANGTSENYKSEVRLNLDKNVSHQLKVELQSTAAAIKYRGERLSNQSITKLKWIQTRTLPLLSLPDPERIAKERDLVYPNVTLQKTAVSPSTLRLGILLSSNQSWYSMKKIPISRDVKLYAYDNSQPGFGISGFMEKPLSKRLSLRTGVGYHSFKNRSTLESQIYFDMANVVETSTGEAIYQTDLALMNPLGDYSTLIEFPVSDQMHQNDLMQENTQIKQIIKSVDLNASLNYAVIFKQHFNLSLGTGIGFAYRTGLDNEFDVSLYHNDILYKNQTELPTQLNEDRRWYGQTFGKIAFEYRPSDRLGLIFESQYISGITSLRNAGINKNGPQTYLHAFIFSAGITQGF